MDFMTCNRIIALLERIVVAVEKTKELSDVDTNAKTPKPPFRPGTDGYANAMRWARSVGLRDTRMIKALAKAGISSFNDVSVENLTGIKHCGALTTQRLLMWAKQRTECGSTTT